MQNANTVIRLIVNDGILARIEGLKNSNRQVGRRCGVDSLGQASLAEACAPPSSSAGIAARIDAAAPVDQTIHASRHRKPPGWSPTLRASYQAIMRRMGLELIGAKGPNVLYGILSAAPFFSALLPLHLTGSRQAVSIARTNALIPVSNTAVAGVLILRAGIC